MEEDPDPTVTLPILDVRAVSTRLREDELVYAIRDFDLYILQKRLESMRRIQDERLSPSEGLKVLEKILEREDTEFRNEILRQEEVSGLGARKVRTAFVTASFVYRNSLHRKLPASDKERSHPRLVYSDGKKV